MISAWWLLLVPVGLIVGMIIGAVFMSWYFTHQFIKTMGFKNWRDFKEKMKKAQQLQKQMKKGHFQMDEDLRKKMEEIAKRFSQ